MKRKLTTLLIVPILLILSGCPKNPYSIAVHSSDDVASGITQANAAADQIRQDGLITPTEEKSVLDYLHFANSLNGQFQTCAKTVNDGGGKVADYLTCAKTFSAGLKNPQELSAIRIVSSQGQSRVQLILTGVQGIVDTLISAYGGTN